MSRTGRQEAVGAEPPEEFRLLLARQLVFPNPHHAPPAGAEGAGDETVAGLVGGNFLPPKRRVGLRLRAVNRTAVPEATVNEDDEFVRGENKIWFAEQRLTPSPACDAVRAQQSDEAKLGAAISVRANGRHHSGTLSFREDVGHRAIMPLAGNGQSVCQRPLRAVTGGKRASLDASRWRDWLTACSRITRRLRTTPKISELKTCANQEPSIYFPAAAASHWG